MTDHRPDTQITPLPSGLDDMVADLIERSSLGTAAAMQLRARTSPQVIDQIRRSLTEQDATKGDRGATRGRPTKTTTVTDPDPGLSWAVEMIVDAFDGTVIGEEDHDDGFEAADGVA